jgi:predicted RND superfamily exporter protein
MILDNLLEKIAHIQTKHYALVLIITLIFTIIVGSGIALIQVESDFSKEMPQDFPITKLNNTITDKFGGQDIIILVLRIDQNSNANNTIQDIRDPTVTDYLITLENELKTKTEINNVTSVGTILKNFNPKSIEQTKTILSNIPEATSFYNKDYTATIIYVTSELGENNNRVIAITDLVNEKINDISLPPGTKINITGEPPIKVTLLDILVKDAIYTLLLSTIFIIILVYLFERSLKNTAIIVTPIFLELFGLWVY